jgi:hypothetical protein
LASCSRARTSRLSSGTSNVPYPSTVSFDMATFYSTFVRMGLTDEIPARSPSVQTHLAVSPTSTSQQSVSSMLSGRSKSGDSCVGRFTGCRGMITSPKAKRHPGAGLAGAAPEEQRTGIAVERDRRIYQIFSAVRH